MCPEERVGFILAEYVLVGVSNKGGAINVKTELKGALLVLNAR